MVAQAGKVAMGSPMRRKLTYWDSNPNPGRTESFTLAGETFASREGLEFEYVPMRIETYVDDVLAAWEAGSGPDVIDVWPLWIPRLMEAGRLLDLGPWVESWPAREAYDPCHAALSRSVGGRYRFLACDLFVQGTHFRKDLVEAAGLDDPRELDVRGEWDIAAFARTARALDAVASDVHGISIRGGQGGELTALNLMVSANNGRLFDAGGRCLLDTPEAVEALDTYTALGRDSIAQPGAPTDGYRQFAWHFYEGRAAMMLHNDDAVKATQSRYLGPERYRNCGLPSPDGKPRLGLAGFGAGVHRESPLADAAARYVCFFVENYSHNLQAGSRDGGTVKAPYVSCGPMHPWPEERAPQLEPFRSVMEDPNRFFALPYANPDYGKLVADTLQPGLSQLLTGKADAAAVAATWARGLERGARGQTLDFV